MGVAMLFGKSHAFEANATAQNETADSAADPYRYGLPNRIPLPSVTHKKTGNKGAPTNSPKYIP